ncbi:putative ABC-type branched-chain amino acid transport system, periplasmic component [Bradyrhizobium sp. ORS 285]|uniref:ABC transporter substrate-binding protein n=1 Tax=Bradyrhizobium sp. ORS 285 TaxID=115808 RepID=UPI0002409533|nr:ABC transporter substrate-binding protein [Bradyrhizobium sp. ORS 285]CCD88122.1 putative ABC-type branched-chain amino acid transport system, periplasmic component [Bradyrhizobium sp. ORS 285]SMX58893.1 putative ABC-type branched-chain amino acid transport system, periplasmic component [Bradyrhizobium sp. ORS 285]
MTVRWCALLLGVCFLASPASALAISPDAVRDLASRVGPVVGQAATCREIAQGRVQTIIDQFSEVIRQGSSNTGERDGLIRSFNSYIAEGRGRVASSQVNCQTAERQLAELERSLSQQQSAAPSLSFSLAPSTAAAATQPTANLPPPLPRGVSETEIRFGTVIPFSGVRKESARQMKVGIETAFNRANDAGGINGRKLRLIAADDAYDPSKTIGAMTHLYEKEQVFGFIGNMGTANNALAIPYALERRALFFAPYSGSAIVRRDPPDRYVFNYRASYAEETAAIVHYLMKVKRIPAKQIAVFAQNDGYGDDGANGVAKAFRAQGITDPIIRYGFPRGTLEVDEAVSQLKAQKPTIKAVIMIATDRAAAKFIEKTHEAVPGLIYANISAVGSSSLAAELKLLGPKYTKNVIVTQGVPSVAGYSSLVLDYKTALEKYFPGEAPDYTSLEGFISANILIQALKQTTPLDTERLVDTLESMQNIDLGLGSKLSFGRAEHQASHKIWGTALDETGTYQAIELE